MELRPGYKQTEVGVIPEDWETVRLADVSSFITKGSTPTTYGFGWQSTGVVFLRSECVSPNGLDLAQSMFISVEAHRALRRSAVQSNDLLITITGNVGRVVMLPDDFGEANINQHIARIRIIDEATDPGWVFHVLSQPGMRQHFEKITTGQAYPQISLVQVRDAVIPCPALPDQRAIAAALSDVDALLGGLDRLIAKKRDLKQAAMQQLLTGQTRLAGFCGAWEVKRVGRIAEIKTGPFGSALHKSDYVREGTPIITVEHLGEFGVEHANLPLVSDCDRQRLRSYILEVGDIVVSRVGSVDRNALIRESEEGWLFSGRLLRVRPYRKHAVPTFLSYQFHGEAFITAVHEVAVGQTMASLNTKLLSGVAVALPSLPEQTAIASVLSGMDAELSALEARRDKTRDLKWAMMQELLTGKTRLVPAGAVHA